MDKDLAIDPGQVSEPIDGIPTQDPAFGLEAAWIEPVQREEAQSRGYTVVDVPTVIATHLSKLLQEHAHELFGHQEAQELVDRLEKQSPKLVEELVPKTLPLSAIVRVCQELLRDRIPVSNMRTICQTLAEHGRTTQDPDVLVGHVRVALGRAIVQRIGGSADELPVITFEPQLEQILQEALAGTGGTVEPTLAERLQEQLATAVGQQDLAGQPAILLVAPTLRSWLARFLRFSVPSLNVLGYNEVPDNKRIRLVRTVGA